MSALSTTCGARSTSSRSTPSAFGSRSSAAAPWRSSKRPRSSSNVAERVARRVAHRFAPLYRRGAGRPSRARARSGALPGPAAGRRRPLRRAPAAAGRPVPGDGRCGRRRGRPRRRRCSARSAETRSPASTGCCGSAVAANAARRSRPSRKSWRTVCQLPVAAAPIRSRPTTASAYPCPGARQKPVLPEGEVRDDLGDRVRRAGHAAIGVAGTEAVEARRRAEESGRVEEELAWMHASSVPEIV